MTDEVDTINVVYDTAGLGPGSYAATITIDSIDAFRVPKTIGVTLDVTLSPPDYDSDGDVDQEDFGFWQNCFTSTGVIVSPGLCADYADLNTDTAVDQLDLQLFEECATGADVAYEFGVTCVLPDWP